MRYDKQSEELCVCIERYSDDIRSDGWGILKELWGKGAAVKLRSEGCGFCIARRRRKLFIARAENVW